MRFHLSLRRNACVAAASPACPASRFPSRNRDFGALALLLRDKRILVAWTLAAACATATPARAQQTVELDGIAAIVNDDVITRTELEARVKRVSAELRASGTATPSPRRLRAQVLERLIVDRIQLQLADGSGIRIDDAALNRALLRIAQQNGFTLRQFRDVLERDGYDFATFREDIRDELAISELRRREIDNRIQISNRDIDFHLSTIANQESEAERYQYRLGHILVAVPDGASTEEISEARARAEDLVGELRDGADFANLAVTHSDGQQALEGGDLGWRQASELPTIFSEAVPRLKIGEVTDPIRSASGFHLVRLIDRRDRDRQIVRQTRARHILIAPDELTDEAGARRLLAALRERIVNGEDFGELARAHSDDTGSAPRGGDLGWIDPGNTVAEFEKEMNSLELDELSEPFGTRYGWHILHVLERREHDDTEAVRRTEAMRRLRARKVEESLQAWIRRIRNEAYVEYRLGE